MGTQEVIFPFRWDVSQKAQLGKLTRPIMIYRDGECPKELPVFPYPQFLDELAECCAEVLAQSGNGDLYFVGRSPDNLYDYLSSLLSDTSWRERLHPFHFSMYFGGYEEVAQQYPQALTALYAYFTYLKLDPIQLAKRKGTVTFVDIVCSGGTIKHLISLMRYWCTQTGVAWEVVKLKIRLVAIVHKGS